MIRDGYLEVVEFSSAFLYVEGWLALDTSAFDDTALTLTLAHGASTTDIVLDDLTIRPDLESTPDITKRAFRCLAPFEGGMPLGSVRWTVNGAPLSAAAPKPFVPRGRIDLADSRGVSGWIFHPTERGVKPVPGIEIDGRLAIELELKEHRDDLPFGKLLKGAPIGFRLTISEFGRLARGADTQFNLLDGDHTLALMSSGLELDLYEAAFAEVRIGKVEGYKRNALVGWAADRTSPGTICNLELAIDGVRYRTFRATGDRQDLKKKGIVTNGGGFQVEIPEEGADSETMHAEVYHEFQGTPLAGGPFDIPTARNKVKDRRAILDIIPESRPVHIIVPVYNAPDDVERCIESVVRHTTFPATLLIIDDASPDPRIKPILERWANWPGITVVTNPENLGFTRTVNKGIQLAGSNDVIFLNSDTIVASGWIEGLRTAAYSGRRVGTATAVSDNAGAFSVPEIGVRNSAPTGFGVPDMARLVRQESLALYPSVPTGNGFCMYVRRDCIEKVGMLDAEAFPRGYGEENDFCMRAMRAGYVNVVDDRTFVHHRRSASFGDEKTGLYAAGGLILNERYPEYRRLTSVFSEDSDMLWMRWRIRRALQRLSATKAVPLPRMLFVISTQTGGTPQTNRDLMDALSDRYEPWVLRCDSRVIELRKHGPDNGVVVETRRLERPIPMSAHRSSEYDACVGDLILRHAFELVHVRHIAWHGLGLIEVCHRLSIPVVMSFHDFYTVCPTVKLLDENNVYCAGKCTPTEGDCKGELWPQSSIPPLKHRFVHRWKELMSQAFEFCDAFVTTSPAAKDVMVDNYPMLAERDFRVILHGREFAHFEALATSPSIDEPLRILVPGNISIAKGADLIRAVSLLDIHGEIEFHVLGDPESIKARSNIIIHGKYKREEFASHVQKIRPHVGAVLSIWPETYCHTLTEMWTCGLPVVAVDIGAVGERIAESQGGWLVEPGVEAAALLKLLLDLKRNPRSVREKIDRVLDWQEVQGRHYDTKAMAVEYDLLYRQVINRRRTFANPSAEAHLATRVALVLAPRDRRTGRAPASTHIRIIQRTANSVARPVIFRTVTASYPWGDRLAGTADLVLLQRNVVKPFDVQTLVDACRRADMPIVLDLDDDLTRVPADKDPTGSYADGAPAIAMLVANAALVLASTPPLKERLETMSSAVSLLPNVLSARLWTMQAERLKPAAQSDGRAAKVLYMGSATHDDDLAMVSTAFKALHEAGTCELHVAGGQRQDEDWFQRIDVPDVAKDYPGFVAWFKSVAPDYDLAVAPLRDTPFNDAKSDLKLLDYGAAGLPTIASRVSAYEATGERAGTLLVSGDITEWLSAVTEVCSNPDLRRRMSRQTTRYILSSRIVTPSTDPIDALLVGVCTPAAAEATALPVETPLPETVGEVAAADA